MMRTRGVWPLLILTVAGMARADRVYLTNGRHVDGLLRSESPTQVVLQVEGGEMQIARHRIREIRYSSPAEAQRIEQAWQKKYFLNKAYVPPGMTQLAERARALKDRREAAANARRSLDRSADRERELRRRRDALSRDLSSAGEQLRAMSPEEDVHAYNALITRINDLRNQVSLQVEALQALPALKSGWQDLIAGYREELESLRAEAARRHSGAGDGSDAEERTFLNRLAVELTRMADEFHTRTAVLDGDDRSHTLRVTVNDGAVGRFVVDTGAMLVTLSESFARRAGIDGAADGDTMHLVLANGDAVEGVAVVLDRVNAGGVEARGVPAVVLKTGPGKGIDGLLGMSFLGRFQLRMDSGSRSMTFTEFVPGE